MKIIILDRDGVINHDSEHYIKSVEEFIPIDGSIDAITRLSHAGYKVVICTNQSGIGRRLYTMKTLNDMHQKLYDLVENQGGKIAGIFICPHTPEDNCDCRKPKPKMIIDICNRFGVDNKSDLMFVGDSYRDLETIMAVGGIPVLVKTGNGKRTIAKHKLPENVLIFDDLLHFSEYIIHKED